MAEAVGLRFQLQSVSLDLRANHMMGDDTGTALAGALKENCVLQSVKLALSNTTIRWKTRTTLERCIRDLQKRNRELPGHWLAVACFARYATKRGGLGMPEKEFRRSLFGFFLPGGAAP